MDPAIEFRTHLGARLNEISEAAVLLEQVRTGGDQVAFSDLHRRLRPTLGLRVIGDASVQDAAVVPPDRNHLGCRTGTPATRSSVTVFSLSVSRYVGAPPTARNVVSRHDTSVPIVRSHVARMTRNRDHASQAQNKFVRRPPIRGPSPQSNCSHIPGSGTHGRYLRR